ncbi:MAG: 1-deoxy-D-xylulose-5-phosphate reductoisomerase [Myxococcota bacterium]
MKNVAILGSTGSIGTQALSVIEKNLDRFSVYALSANSNISLLHQQIKRFHPEKVVLMQEEKASELKRLLNGSRVKILIGDEGLKEVSTDRKIDIILIALTGIKGLESVINSIDSGIRVALANKESLVAGGRFVMDVLKKRKGEILPVDSEHSAIFQLLSKERRDAISKLILTATGGPFRGKSKREMRNARVEDVLRHPRWKMGKKVSIDSATMVNKAFEMIEAHFLFGFNSEDIRVVVHPQAIVHSLIQMRDGSYLAHIGPTDMRIPIGYALSYPERLENILSSALLSEMGDITFEKLRKPFDRPVEISREIIEEDPDRGIVFNAADEIAVESFLSGIIRFGDIINIIEYSLKHIKPFSIKTVVDVLNFDMDIKRFLRGYINKRL